MKKKEDSHNYTTVSIPIPLAERIDEAVKTGLYKNRPDFVLSAIRKLLEEQEA